MTWSHQITMETALTPGLVVPGFMFFDLVASFYLHVIIFA